MLQFFVVGVLWRYIDLSKKKKLKTKNSVA